MRYEKKMLILSGEGKGVVLIEKSGLGVRFALRTFGLKRGEPKKVGIITSSDIVVRDLPDTDDPSLVFYLDGTDTETIHFAVFDRELILYGTNGKRMWEANLMGLLRAHDRAGKPIEELPASLPPLIEKPKVLPLPDGTGLPQSRDAIYGDEALAESDFYTRLDMSERMKIVDGFLDTPRILNEKPSVKFTRLENPSVVAANASGAQDREDVDDETAEQIERTEVEDGREYAMLEEQTETENTEVAEVKEGSFDTATEHVVDMVQDDQDGYAESAQAQEAAATADCPWQYEARFLCKMSKRTPVIDKPKVEPLKVQSKVPPIRETAFFERARGDIDKLFSLAERDDELCALLPDVEFVRVEFDGHVVSVGRTNELLCYAVEGLYEKVSPLGEEAQWLPRIKSAPTGRGYWLVFQDINSGKILQS